MKHKVELANSRSLGPDQLAGETKFIELPAIAMSIRDVAAALGVGRTTIYKAIAESRLETRKLGRRTLVLTASITRLLQEATDGE